MDNLINNQNDVPPAPRKNKDNKIEDKFVSLQKNNEKIENEIPIPQKKQTQ